MTALLLLLLAVPVAGAAVAYVVPDLAGGACHVVAAAAAVGWAVLAAQDDPASWGDLVTDPLLAAAAAGTALLVVATRPHSSTAAGAALLALTILPAAAALDPLRLPDRRLAAGIVVVALLAAVRLWSEGAPRLGQLLAVLAGVVIATGLIGADAGEATALAVSGTTVAVVAAAVWGAPGRVLLPAGLLAVSRAAPLREPTDGIDRSLLVVALLVVVAAVVLHAVRARPVTERLPLAGVVVAAALLASDVLDLRQAGALLGAGAVLALAGRHPVALAALVPGATAAIASLGLAAGVEHAAIGVGAVAVVAAASSGPLRAPGAPAPASALTAVAAAFAVVPLWGWAGVDLEGHPMALAVTAAVALPVLLLGLPARRDLTHAAVRSYVARPRVPPMAPPASPSPSRKPAKGKPAPKRRSFLWRFRRSLFLGALLFVASVAGAGFVLAQVEVPRPDPLLQSTFVCAADVVEGCGADNAMAKLSGEEDRVSVPLEEMPQIFIDAVLAAEDRQFFSHSGIDPLGIARAIYRDFKGDRVQQGGSTITQQYAKNAFLSSERTVTRKLKEAVLAVKLERDLSKQEILERYLNTVYFGRGAYGAEAASRAYFGTSIRNVSLPQAAYLAGLIRSPESADATSEPERATFRRDSVLTGMVRTSAITQAERDEAAAVPIGDMVQPRTPRDGVSMVKGADVGATYYVEYVRRLLYEEYGAEVVNGGGLRVYTAVDLDLQREAFGAVWETLNEPDDPAGALVSIDDVGRVVAMVGGRDFDTSEVNLALGAAAGGSGRQPGSSFKPIVLATALERGISLNSRFLNEYERTFPDANAGEDWEVTNYARGEEEVVDLVEATRVSSNTVFAQLMLEVGPANAVDLAKKLGIASELPAVNSLVLGSGEVSVLDMANAYSTFARDGEAIEPIIITKVEQVVDGEVKVLSTNTADTERAVSETTAAQVSWALRQVVLGGTGTGANPGFPVAGKTGTTQDYRDAWFVGYTPKLTTAVWMGYPDVDAEGRPRFMRDVRGRDITGGSFPAQIWKRFMQAAVAGQDHGDFPKPTFTGEALGADLTTTTETPTTLPYCDDDETPDEDDCRVRPTTTTDPDDTTTTEPDEGDETSTTTTQPRSTTTAPSSTTTTTTTAPTTTAPSSTTTRPGGGVIQPGGA